MYSLFQGTYFYLFDNEQKKTKSALTAFVLSTLCLRKRACAGTSLALPADWLRLKGLRIFLNLPLPPLSFRTNLSPPDLPPSPPRPTRSEVVSESFESYPPKAKHVADALERSGEIRVFVRLDCCCGDSCPMDSVEGSSVVIKNFGFDSGFDFDDETVCLVLSLALSERSLRWSVVVSTGAVTLDVMEHLEEKSFSDRDTPHIGCFMEEGDDPVLEADWCKTGSRWLLSVSDFPGVRGSSKWTPWNIK